MDRPTTGGALAAEERQRLVRLLEVDSDGRLRPASAEVTPLSGAEWSAGFIDSEIAIGLAVYFIPDPVTRQRISSEIEAEPGETVRVSTNGGLLLVARTMNNDDPTRERIDELLSRFAGRE
jgi:hypothetical protein